MRTNIISDRISSVIAFATPAGMWRVAQLRSAKLPGSGVQAPFISCLICVETRLGVVPTLILSPMSSIPSDSIMFSVNEMPLRRKALGATHAIRVYGSRHALGRDGNLFHALHK